jgi:hypothetical protein
LKAKLSVTVDETLLEFLDRAPGPTRSAKLEGILRRFRAIAEDLALRRALTAHREVEAERIEREAWERTMESDQWREFAAAKSGR